MADIETIKKQAAADVETVKNKARHAIEVLQRDKQTAQEEAKAAKAELDETKHELERIRKNAELHEQRVAELSEAMKNNESKISDEREERVASLKAELARAQEEISRLTHAAQNGNHTNGESDQLREELVKTQEKLNQIKDAARTHVIKMQGDLAHKERERAEAIAEVEKLRVALAEAQSTPAIPHFSQAVADHEADLQRGLEESQTARKAAEERIAKLEADLAKVTDAAKKKITSMQEELQKKTALEESLRKQVEDETKRVTETYEAQIKALKEAAATASTAASQMSRTPAPSDALVRMNKENKELQSKLDAATKALQTERDDYKTQSKTARDSIERLTKERTDLKREADSAKEEARLLTKDLDKAKVELKRLQDQRVSIDPAEMKKRSDQEIQVYVEKNMKLEEELRRAHAKAEDLQRKINGFDSEIARMAGTHLARYTKLEEEVLEKRSAVQALEDQVAELQRTNAVNEQRFDELRRKSRDQFQALTEQLEQARRSLEQSKAQEEAVRSELASLRRQNEKAGPPVPTISQSPPLPVPSRSPTPNSMATFKILEEEKAKAESKRREAMDDLTKAKRDYNSAKREAIQLADAVDRLRSGLNKAALQAGGNLALAADRCDDALRQCVLQIEAALAAVQARELAKAGNPSQSAGLADDENRMMRARQSSAEEIASPSDARKEQEPEERLVNALNDAERRLDEMTASLRTLLPKVKQVATIAVQDKKSTSVLASICNLSAILAKYFNRNVDRDPDQGYTGLQMQSAQRPSRRGGRVLPDTPGELNFDLEEE